MPECGQALQFILRARQILTLHVGSFRSESEPMIDLGEAYVFRRFAFRFMLGGLACLLGSPQVGGEPRELLMTGFPKPAQLKEHESAEGGAGIGEQVSERVQLLLHANGGALLLLEAVA